MKLNGLLQGKMREKLREKGIWYEVFQMSQTAWRPGL